MNIFEKHLIKSTQRNRKIFMFSELDHIAAIREPDIILKNNCVQPKKQEGRGCGEASQPSNGTKLSEGWKWNEA